MDDVFHKVQGAVMNKCEAQARLGIVSVIPLRVYINSNRWVWSEFKDGVVIEDYLKTLNMNPKRRIVDSDGRT